MLNNLFGGDDNNNMILIIILIFLLLGGGSIFGGDCKDRDRCNDGFLGGLFGGDNIIWILILLFFIGDIF